VTVKYIRVPKYYIKNIQNFYKTYIKLGVRNLDADHRTNERT
jgi:hypothetical protein